MTQGTHETIPSDLQVAHRTPINLTADGQIQAIPIHADNAKHHMVLVINLKGGLAVIGGLDLRQLMKPAPGEAGAAEMIEIMRLVAQVDVAGIDDDNVDATARLHGAIREYVSMKRQAEAVALRGQHASSEVGRLRDILRQISTAALRSIQVDPAEQGAASSDPEAAVDHVRRLIGALTVWQQGAVALIEKLTGGGKAALPAPGALREIVTSGEPLAFWSHLRETLAELQAKGELFDRRGGADIARQTEAEAAFRALGRVLPEYADKTLSLLARVAAERIEAQRDDIGAAQALAQVRGILEQIIGRTPDPARSTVQLAREVEAMVQRLGGREAEDELQTIAERVGPLIGEAQIASYGRKPGEVARAVRSLADMVVRLRDDVAQLGGEGRQRPETDVELHDRLARDRGPGADEQIVAAVKLALGDVEVRLHKPGAGILRVIVPAAVPPADCDAALELLRSSLPATVNARIEQEPGKPPEGYTVNAYEVNDGEAPSSPHVADGAPPTNSWSMYEWHGEGATDVEFKTEAAAVDSAWEAWVDGQQPQDAADAEPIGGAAGE